jgi:hypothetical protein
MTGSEPGGYAMRLPEICSAAQASRAARDKVITNRYASILSLLFRSAVVT